MDRLLPGILPAIPNRVSPSRISSLPARTDRPGTRRATRGSPRVALDLPQLRRRLVGLPVPLQGAQGLDEFPIIFLQVLVNLDHPGRDLQGEPAMPDRLPER